MDNETTFAIHPGTYAWCVRVFAALERHLGLSIKPHDPDRLLGRGQIFVFNHFTRFETLIPPFLLYRATGAQCRSVADRGLFHISEGFSGFLRGIGVIPNDLPALLPFLAAEILRGRKVVIFPEGEMVKDRGAFSREGHKPHRGAAVLALVLDIFKRRILDLHRRGDEARLGRWVKALGLRDREELLARAREPTLIVPGTITFYPLRVQEHVLSYAMSRLVRDLPPHFAEEMLVEGNILLRDTDMDIRLSDPIPLPDRRRWWGDALIRHYFRKVRSLDDLFGLKADTAGIAERLLALTIRDNSERVRDAYMDALHRGTTLNLSHLAAQIITRLVERGERGIDRARFHRILYLAVKEIQTVAGLHLHRSLAWPGRYRSVLDGENADLDRFLETCREAGLIGRTPRTVTFSDRLRDDYDIDRVRIENPLRVYANEIALLPDAVQAVDVALDRAATLDDSALALLLFEDERRAHAWNRGRYAGDGYAAINRRETATADGAPYLLRPPTPSATGIVLIHDFLSSPAELRPFADRLARLGHTVMGVRLAGHGTSPCDLATRRWDDWLASARRGHRILSAFTDRIVVIGVGGGGSLALMLAADAPPALAGIVAVAAPDPPAIGSLALTPLIDGLTRMTGWFDRRHGSRSFHDNRDADPAVDYRSIPRQSLREVRRLLAEMNRRLPSVTAPVLLVHGTGDSAVPVDPLTHIVPRLSGAEVSVVRAEGDRHRLVREDAAGIEAEIVAFIARATGPEARPEPMAPRRTA
jgi:esterase/lipase/1-acyl-sn-glycerol-3-phosphate acyltransferase